MQVGRKLEAKDAARCALRSPWWTLGASYADVATIAGWGEEQIEFMRERVSDEGRREDLLKGKDLAQVLPYSNHLTTTLKLSYSAEIIIPSWICTSRVPLSCRKLHCFGFCALCFQ